MFSEYGTNFVKTILRLARTNPTLRVAGDHHGRPTYAGDLARLIAGLGAGRALPYGTFHAVGGPATTWHGFAEAIVTEAHREGLIERRPEVIQITTPEYPTPAQRPANSVLEPSVEIDAELDWPAGLRTVLVQLKTRGGA